MNSCVTDISAEADADTYNPISTERLPGQLRGAGFRDIHVDVLDGTARWHATKP
jgi:hypothetical protein